MAQLSLHRRPWAANPWSSFDQLRREMDSLLDRFGGTPSSTWRGAFPAVNLYETADGWTLEADLTGVTRDQLHIEVEQGVLTLHAEAHTGLPGTRVHAEFDPVIYDRKFQLGDTVDLEKISAALNDGVLRLTLPRVEASKPRRKRKAD